MKLTTQAFIEKSILIHGDKYDYSRVEYRNNKTKVCIICPIHGEFWQTPQKHLSGHGCPKCAKTQKNTNEEFVRKAKLVHGEKYDYSKSVYVNNRTKVCIICPIHGEFWQTPGNHLQGKGCAACGGKQKLDKEKFVQKAKDIHDCKYDYSKVAYINYGTKVRIICPLHGEFWQTPYNHIVKKCGCPNCGKEGKIFKKALSTEEFIIKARHVHGNKYDYSKVKYKNNRTKVCIICPVHGEFWQKANNHLNGSGCPKCKMSHIERSVLNILEHFNIEYEIQKRFKWLKTRKKEMSLDFYLPEHHIAIECQGEQHYNARGMFTRDVVSMIKKRDILKRQLCKEHNIYVHYVKYNENAENNIKKLIYKIYGEK